MANFQPLTQDQYNAAINSGFTPDQIIANEQKRKQSFSTSTTGAPTTSSLTDSGIGSLPGFKQATQLGVGIGTAVGKAGLGLGETFLKGVNWVGKKIGAPNDLTPAIKGIEDIKKNIYEKPFQKETASLPGKVGSVIGGAVPFVESTGPIVAGQKAAAGLTKGLPYLVRLAGQVAPEILGTTATEFGVSGGDKKSAVEAGLTAGVLSTLTHVGSDVFNQVIPQTVKDNVSRFLGFTGKTSLSSAASGKKVDDAVGAMTTISRLAPDIKVTDVNGVEKTFDPLKTNFVEMPQALSQAKNKIYQTYTDLASQAGAKVNFTSEDFNSVMTDLDKYSGKGYTNAFSNKASQIKDAISRYGTLGKDGAVSFADTPPLEIQKLIESINKDVNPLSDAAGAQVASDASVKLRDIMDKKITSATGEGYQKVRDAYSQLKSLEPDIINQYKKAMRSAGFKPGIIDGIASLDTLMGIVTKSPIEMARGISIETFNKLRLYLKDPEVNLQRAFKLINDGGAESTGLKARFLGGAKPPTQ